MRQVARSWLLIKLQCRNFRKRLYGTPRSRSHDVDRGGSTTSPLNDSREVGIVVDVMAPGLATPNEVEDVGEVSHRAKTPTRRCCR